MSNTALICTLEDNGNYIGIPVHFDGYIEGVGKCLIDHWKTDADVQKLFNEFDNREIRALGENFESTEFYPISKNKYAAKYLKDMLKRLGNMSIDQLKNEAGNFDFVYVWDGVDWFWFDVDNNALQPVRSFLTVEK